MTSLAALGGSVVAAVEPLPGPIPATVTEVVDGDTIGVRARIWLGQEVQIRVRVLGIDTPELRGDCQSERSLAEQARAEVVRRVLGQEVLLWDIAYGKYAGGVTARVTTTGEDDLGEVLILAGLARAYDGGARQPWCPEAADGA